MPDIVDLMVKLLESDVVEAKDQVRKTKGAHARISWFRENFKKCLKEADDTQEDGDIEEMRVKRDQVICIYLIYLVGVTLFTDNNAK